MLSSLDVIGINSTFELQHQNSFELMRIGRNESANEITTDSMITLLLTVLTAGGTVNKECWLLFPLTCSGCHYEMMHARGIPMSMHETLDDLYAVCNAIKGFEYPSNLGLTEEILLTLQNNAMYEPTIRPHFPSKPEIIKVSFQLVSIENLDITDSSFKIDCFLHQEWSDYRLRHNYRDLLDVTALTNGIWYPDTYFVQAKSGEYNSLDKGFSLKVSSDGTVYSTLRLMIQISCFMDFYNFPMDVQKCKLYLESCNWSTLVFEFVFVRNSIIFIPALYFPCAIIVFISWITFFLEHEHYPARTYLNVTSMLTIITVQAAMEKSIPKVGYIKSIDTYVLVCILFISAAFTEYAVVLYMFKKRGEYLINRKARLKMNYRTRMKLIERNLLINKRDVIDVNNEDVNCELSNKMLEKDYKFLTKFDKLLRFYLRDGWPKKIDFCARIAFPAAFLVFNIIYWVSTGRSGEE